MICSPPLTRKEARWEYEQYYLGEKDEDNRKCGEGELHFSGAQSLESYTGHFIRDTMHGEGDYRWRFHGPQHSCVTYEGNFYCNRLHGYGTMSYPDGRTFSGIYFNNVRWGPGVQSHANVHEDVGLWRAGQLVRLAWQPDGPSIAPDFTTTNIGKQIVESNRIKLTTVVETIGMTNKAVELLKQCGADPRVAVKKWSKVYPKYCTDLASPLCHSESFDQDYYNGKMFTLKEVNNIPDGHKLEPSTSQTAQIDEDASEILGTYYACNNNNIMINMMKHSYKHDKQRCSTGLDIKAILSGPRRRFKPAGDYEIDCWTLLMAAYLGRVEDVAYLVNEKNVHPDISDVRGNSAIMYAAVGDQPDVIHFLVEAGANVDSYNDSCCTPLGVALMRYVCARHDVPPSVMLQALLPPAAPQVPPPIEPTVKEWNKVTDRHSDTFDSLSKSPSKSARIMSSKKIKSLISIKDQPGAKSKMENVQTKGLNPIYESITDDNTLYRAINREYCIKITDTFTTNGAKSPVSYIFDVNDMIKEVDIVVPEEDERKNLDKSIKKMKSSSKTFKDTRKTSKEAVWKKSSEKAINSLSSVEKIKEHKLSKIMTTLKQLLTDGANPKLVQCPQSAPLIAVMSNSPDLVRYLVDCGANINENYHQVFDYTPLDVAVSRPLTQNNLEIVKVILECGGDAQHRIVTQNDLKDPNDDQIQGPTLLHIVLAKKAETEFEEDIRRQLLELLLKYNCSPITFYKGRSALDIAMCKDNYIFYVFIKNPKTDLNSVINQSNQSMLLKLFSFPYFRSISSKVRLQRLTDLLLFGADPLLKCQNHEETYENIFVFTKQCLNEMDSVHTKIAIEIASSPATKPPETSKKAKKPKKDEKSLSNKLIGKAADDVEEYKQAVGLVTDCARLLYIRWLQAKLVKELIATIDKYKHRHWNMILKSCENTISIGIWLSPQRCLEIWDILSETKNKIYRDQRIITHLLSIVVFLSWQNSGRHTSNAKLTIQVKDIIDSDVKEILSQHKADKKEKSAIQWKLTYVKPEIDKHGKKFNVCFECILPLSKEKIICSRCQRIYFCSYDCMKSNVHRPNCHPCSDYLKMKYFPSTNENNEEVTM